MSKRVPVRSKLSEKYRMVIIDDDTLRELRSTKFSIWSLIFGITAIVILLIVGTYLSIAYTPLKNFIPGYADINNNVVYRELSSKIEALENDLNVQKTYTDGFKKILNPTGVKLNEIEGNADKNENFSNDLAYNDKISNQFSLEHYYFCSPLKGEVSAGFDIERAHYGIDIVAPKNTPIQNILDGVVINADWSDRTGHTISVQHKGNLISIFKHNSVLLKKTGDHVKKGEALAVIGNTGEMTTGPHVHLELWHNGTPINPYHYLSFN